jgi:hypothetical protein
VVAAVDGSVIRAKEKKGEGVTVGGSPFPDLNLSFPVVGPLSSLRPEAAVVHEVVSIVPDDSPFLIFIECLVLLVVLARWGQGDFWPDPEDIKRFDIIEPWPASSTPSDCPLWPRCGKCMSRSPTRMSRIRRWYAVRLKE